MNDRDASFLLRLNLTAYNIFHLFRKTVVFRTVYFCIDLVKYVSTEEKLESSEHKVLYTKLEDVR